MTRELTGRHVLLIALSAFGTIISVNMAMLLAATGSFPGLVVKNSYVASQGWNARTAAQAVLGWTATTTYRDGAVHLGVFDRRGAPVQGLHLVATLGRPSTNVEDRVLDLRETPDGFSAPVVLATGLWEVRIRATRDPAFGETAQAFEQVAQFIVTDADL